MCRTFNVSVLGLGQDGRGFQVEGCSERVKECTVCDKTRESTVEENVSRLSGWCNPGSPTPTEGVGSGSRDRDEGRDGEEGVWGTGEDLGWS